MTEYEEGWPYPVAFAPERPAITLADVIAATGGAPAARRRDREVPARHVLLQRRRGDSRSPASGASWCPRRARSPTYDLKPEMSAREAADAFVARLDRGQPRFAIINFANADMVGHTGVIPAAVAAVETVDECLGAVVDAVHAERRRLHRHRRPRQREQMLDPDGTPQTAHTLNPVPLIVTDPRGDARARGRPRRRRADRARSCSGSPSRRR